MCGITGTYHFSHHPLTTADIEQQLTPIYHRGPDEGGVYLSPQKNCGLGIRRLSIIDVAGGQQPLYNETGAIQVVYNGETYNHHALRTELVSLGHQFRTGSDGEVIVHGYEAWGIAGILQRMRGQAAFALWDDDRQTLFLGRDRFGIKPLYYTQQGNRFLFGSEIKTILANPTIPRRINLAALEALFTLGFVPGPATIFEGIYQLSPAHYLQLQANQLEITPYWQLTYTESNKLSFPEAQEAFLALLKEAVNIRLMSEVPLGALLSGGLDSSSLVALMQAQLSQPIKTISIGFEQGDYDERAKALVVAEHIHSNHQPTTFNATAFDDYPTIINYLEAPQCAATCIPIYKLYQACRQAGLTVVLTGEGADELLAGYHWHRGDALMRPLLKLPAIMRRMLAASPLPMSTAARRVLQRGAKSVPQRYQDWLALAGETYQEGLLAHKIEAYGKGQVTKVWLQGWHTPSPDNAPLHQALSLEFQTRMVDFINFEVDKMSMAHSIEARVPFLDHKLWEFCATLPPHFKLNGQTEKYLLRQAMQSYLPAATTQHRKKGLAAPYARWLQASRLPDWAEVALSPQTIRNTGLFEATRVQALRQAHQAGHSDLGALLMGVLSTQVWVQSFQVEI